MITPVQDTIDLRREMVATCRSMNSSGINQGTSGNLSVRTERGFLVTPSSLPYESMQPDDLVEGTLVDRVHETQRLSAGPHEGRSHEGRSC